MAKEKAPETAQVLLPQEIFAMVSLTPELLAKVRAQKKDDTWEPQAQKLMTVKKFFLMGMTDTTDDKGAPAVSSHYLSNFDLDELRIVQQQITTYIHDQLKKHAPAPKIITAQPSQVKSFLPPNRAQHRN